MRILGVIRPTHGNGAMHFRRPTGLGFHVEGLNTEVGD